MQAAAAVGTQGRLMPTALFTSQTGGKGLQRALAEVIATIGDAAAAATDRVEVQIMVFALTDREIGAQLATLLRTHPRLLVRIVADWSQSLRGGLSVLPALLDAGLPNLYVKYKIDAPYRMEGGRLLWSGGSSLGMLHHKTLLLRVGGEARFLLTGSYDWGAHGPQAYENILMFPASATHRPALAAFAAEFAALWSDPSLTATPPRARAIHDRMRSDLAAGRTLDDPARLRDLLGVDPDPVQPPPRRTLVSGPVIAAFSGHDAAQGRTTAGHAPGNARSAIGLMRASGARRAAPLTLGTLGLEAIRSVSPGGSLEVAFPTLSHRVPEYGAILGAAARGVTVRVLLDAAQGRAGAERLATRAEVAGLPLTVRLCVRRMQQHYLVSAETAMVLTGTASAAADAPAPPSRRHSDHRILIRDDPSLARAFATDFDTMWLRQDRHALHVA